MFVWKKKIKVKTWHNIFYTNFTKKFSRTVLTNAAPIWYNISLGGLGGTPRTNFLCVLPLFYYTTKKFLFQDLTRQKLQNFIKKFLLICLTTAGVSWYNKRRRRNLFFFFFFAAREIAAPAPLKHEQMIAVAKRTNVRRTDVRQPFWLTHERSFAFKCLTPPTTIIY